MGPEAKLYQKIKKASPNILWNRIENLSIPGMPDALGYNKRSRGPWSKVLENFFTIPVPWFKDHGA
jgi:hypothetical protein